jgi:TolB-like protein
MKTQVPNQELGVRYVLAGSVRKAGDQVRITAQLVDAMTAEHLWADRYDRSWQGNFSAQQIEEEIVQTIVQKVEATLLALPPRMVTACGDNMPLIPPTIVLARVG